MERRKRYSLYHWPCSFLRTRPSPCSLPSHRFFQLVVAEQAFWFCFMHIMLLPSVHGLSDFLDTDETYETYTNVPRDPIFLSRNNNITVREGGKAELPCAIQHLGTKKVAWRKVDTDKFLTIGKMAWTPDMEIFVQHVKHREELDEWTLVLPKVTKSDAGIYECQLTSIGGYHTLVRLNVVGPPITNPEVKLAGTQFVERGGMIQLQCNATGGMQIAEEIDWFKDGNIISGSRYKDYFIFTYRAFEDGALVSTLQVDIANASHAGTYVCRSSYNKLKDIVVQVLVADSSNVKRGMSPDSNPAISHTQSLSTSAANCLHWPSLSLLLNLVVTLWALHNNGRVDSVLYTLYVLLSRLEIHQE